MLTLRDTTVDLDSGQVVRRDGTRISLTTTEHALLRYLATHPEKPQSREVLLIEVWGYRAGVSSRTVDTAVKTLRRKLEANPSEPDHIFTVHGIGYRFVPSKLPEDTDLIGREDMRTTLIEATAAHRLVTVVGLGGVGKSRLVAGILFGEPVVRVDLVTAGQPEDVLALVSAALGGSGDIEARLAERGPLLVLDNLEQVEGVGPLLSRWAALAEVRVLGTSRVALGVEGEHVVVLDPLDEACSIALFRLRVGAVAPEIAALPNEAILPLVQALGGLPLALELAAGRASILSLSEMVARLPSLELLSAPRRVDRHASIEASIESSWALLSEEDQRTLLWASLFASNLQLDDLEALAGRPAIDSLHRLHAARMVARRPDGLVLHPLIRLFARGRIATLPDPWTRLAGHVLSRTTSPPDALARLPDLAAILKHDVSPELHARAGVRAAAAYGHLSLFPSREQAAECAVEAALQTPDADLISEAKNALVRLHLAMGCSTDAEVTESVAMAREGSTERLAVAMLHRGIHHRLNRDLATAEACLGEAAELAEGALLADVCSELGIVLRFQGRLIEAAALFEQAIVVCDGLKEAPWLAAHVHRLATTNWRLGRVVEAEHLLRRALDLHQAKDFLPGVFAVKAGLAALWGDLGRAEEALEVLPWCLEWADSKGAPDVRILARMPPIEIALERGELSTALTLVNEVRALLPRQAVGNEVSGHFALLEALLALRTRRRADARAALDKAVVATKDSPSARFYALGYRAGLYHEARDHEDLEELVAKLEEPGAAAFYAAVNRRPHPVAVESFHLRMWTLLAPA